ncbi:MAG: hypothetical protein JW829_11245 [Pirellulales bacterium]|nr:hypothetical protein [Pirellulales bacterium]
MRSNQKKIMRLLLCVLLNVLIWPSSLVGQDPADDVEPSDPFAEPVPSAVDPSQYGPAIQTVLEADRRTPEELLQGVLLLIDLGEPKLAEPFFQRLIQAELDTPTKASLARRFGTHRMMRLARAKDLGKEAASFVDACMAALAAELRDPKRLEKLVDELGDPAIEVRRAAIADLAESGPDAAAFLVAALVQPNSSARSSGLVAALVELRPASIGPLTAALSVESAEAKRAVIQALGQVAPGHATTYLLAPALADPNEDVRQAATQVLLQTIPQIPSPEDAESILTRSVMAYLDGQLPATPDAENLVEIWTWDAASDKPVPQRLPATDARILAAGELADDLVTLQPDHAGNQMLHLLCQLSAAKISTGLDAPLPETFKKLGEETSTTLLESVLSMALERDFLPAAIAAVEWMGDRGDAQVLYSSAPERAPLVDALQHADRRLRYAALKTVMKLNPSEPFSGASYVPEALEFFLLGEQQRVAVGMPDRQRAQTIAGWLASDGFLTIPAGTGREVVRTAVSSSDFEFILVDASIHEPGIREVLYQLRSIPHIRRVPIGVLAGPETFQRADQIAAGDPWTIRFARPQDQTATQAISQQLLTLSDRTRVPTEVRAAQASEALTWLNRLLEQSQPFYDFNRLEAAIRSALASPALAEQAAGALGYFGSRSSQQALVDLASQPYAPISLRQAAAGAFRHSVSHHGIQLAQEEILRQYDRYNASETADLETQKVLGHILDTIEQKNAS